MRSMPRGARLLIGLALTGTVLCSGQSSWLAEPERVAPGVELLRTTDQSLVDRAGPIAVFLLKLDPDQVRLASGLSNDAVVDAERVDAIASRHGAIAAVNGGFFNTQNGEPTGLLKVSGELVSDTNRTRGAVAIRAPPNGKPELWFDQIAATVVAHVRARGRRSSVPIDGVDTTRARGKLMLYTPAYHVDTDTAAGGVEWILAGQPLRVTGVRLNAGKTQIPQNGAVLSYGGLDLPPALAPLTPGTEVSFETRWQSVNGLPHDRLESADHIVNGAGLLKRDGKTMANWQTVEQLSPQSFLDVRHPRTVIGVDGRGFIWLIAVDGRQEHSIGMTFADLVRLCDRLELRDALNLDGGGSTTMVVQGKIVNRPSDRVGPRAVSDAILVKLRSTEAKN